jgi:hypothetical protein
LVKEEMDKKLIEKEKKRESKIIDILQTQDEEDEARTQYEESLEKMKQARERIKKIKTEKEERFKMQLEEQRKEERQRKEKDDEEKRQMLRWVSTQRQESIKNQKEKIKHERKEVHDDLLPGESQRAEGTQLKSTPLEVQKEKSRSMVSGALKLVLEENQKTLELLMNANKGKGKSEQEKLDQEDQRIMEVTLEKLNEPTEESAAIVCGDWLYRIRPVIKNLSKRSAKYWTRLESIVEDRYKNFLCSKPLEKLTLKFKEDEELGKQEYSKVKAVIKEMIMKAIPTILMTEAVQKRYEEPEDLILMIMVKYQPGTKKEKE